MDKRFQVFLSSTFTDLREERDAITRALIEMDCIPAGMEAFPAANSEQMEFIRRIIDDCDYYVLIIGGRYGSFDKDGVSYTRQEYNYAKSKGIPVLAFLHDNIEGLERSKTETSQEKMELLEKFREEVSSGRLVKLWNNSEKLPGDVVLSLNKAIKMYPAIGWIRGDSIDSKKLLAELAEVRRENEKLRRLTASNQENYVEDLDLDDLEASFSLSGQYSDYSFDREASKYNWSSQTTFLEILREIGPDFLGPTDQEKISAYIAERFSKISLKPNREGGWRELGCDRSTMSQIRVQLEALGLIEVTQRINSKNEIGNFWNCTSKGKKLVLSLRAVRAS